MWPNSPAIAFAPRTSCPLSEHADADAFRHGHGDKMPDVLVVPAEPELAERARVRRVLDVRPAGRSPLRASAADRRRASRDSARTRAGRLVDPARQAHADALADHARMRGPQARDRPRHRRTNPARIARRRERTPAPRTARPRSPDPRSSSRDGGRRRRCPVRSTLRCRNLGRRPRGSRPIAPSVTHPSSIS